MSFAKAFLLHMKIAVIIGVTGQLLLFLIWISTWNKDLPAPNFVLGNLVILIAVIVFYKRTTILPLIWTTISLIINVFFTAFEFGMLSLVFNDAFLPHSKYVAVLILAVTASILFAFNKTVLDRLFRYFGIKPLPSIS